MKDKDVKYLFDKVSFTCSKMVTKQYSTSFSLATKMLSPKIRKPIYSIYSFVRFADEIVDSFHDFDKEMLLNKFEEEFYATKIHKISLNPILNAFVQTVHKYGITDDLVAAFFKSMRTDLHKTEYHTREEFENYIHGSANVVGLMCLRVFVNGNNAKYEELKPAAIRLGSALQKVNFLRDIKNDIQLLNRSYFPQINFNNFTATTKNTIIKDMESDFEEAYKNGILKLPTEAKLGVYVAYRYYKYLLKKLKSVPFSEIMKTRVRISMSMKISLIARSYVKYKLNLM